MSKMPISQELHEGNFIKLTCKFRGIDANGKMRYGRLSQDKEESTAYYKEYSQRICWDNSNIPVSNLSLGKYIGLTDKNNVEIYTGDILKYSQATYIVRFGSYDVNQKYNFAPKFCANRFYLELIKTGVFKNINENIYEDLHQENGFAFIFTRDNDYYADKFDEYNEKFGLEIIGNIYDNGELLEEKDNDKN
jgi:uncharacterized phage protein (TIGR01671 family)